MLYHNLVYCRRRTKRNNRHRWAFHSTGGFIEAFGFVQNLLLESMSARRKGAPFGGRRARGLAEHQLLFWSGNQQPLATYPEAVEYCWLCSWWQRCDEQRRRDDHLSFVAGISRLQMTELRKAGVTSLAKLASLEAPLQMRFDRGSPATYERIREQARLQLLSREAQKPLHDVLDPAPEQGLALLPEPSPGDIFLDFEADPYIEEGGLEYLLGYAVLNSAGEPEYVARWAFDRTAERAMFESFLDDLFQRLEKFPDLHINHFSHYEPTALKRLMGRYA
ncbi:MAG: TM0106 family RecB-like putative nuclease, partial [Acidobacteriota bacterium]